MRVRPDRQSTESRPSGRAKLRRPHLARNDRTTESPATSSSSFRQDLADERRLRESGGPRDRATYTCSCGYIFEADVTTSVACPHCGTSQAW